MPPNSFTEWMVGHNMRRQRPRKPRQVFAVALETDDEGESDTLRVTYPRTGRSRNPTRSKKVRFGDSVQHAGTKHAVDQLPLDSDTQASSDADISPDESSTDDDVIMNCPCTNCITARRKLKKSERAKARSKKHLTDSSADEDEASPAVVHAKYKAKKAKEASSSKPKESNGKPKSKQKGSPQAKKSKAKPESEPETTDATDAESGPETDTDTGTNTEASTGGETTEGDTTEAQTTEAETTEAETTEAETTGAETEAESEKETPKKTGKKKSKGKQGGASIEQNKQAKKGKQSSPNQKQNIQNKKQKEGKQEKKAKPASQDEQSNTEGQDAQKSGNDEDLKEKKSLRDKKSPQKARPKATAESTTRSPPPRNPPLDIYQGTFLMPPRPHLLRVEHAIEVQEDPRPNAFYDNSTGVMRVYHGPVYGNGQGMLYSSNVYGNQSLTLPAGIPHPVQNPWYNGFRAARQHGAVSPQAPRTANHSGTPGEDQWHQGDGSIVIGQHTSEFQSSKAAADSDRKQQESTKRQTSPASDTSNKIPKDAESNVLPSIEVTSPEKPKGKNGNGSGESRGIQSDRGSPTPSASKGEKNDKGKKGVSKSDDKESSPSHGKSISDIEKGITKLLTKEKAKAKPKGDRQSDKSGSKESSPAAQWGWNGDSNGSPVKNTDDTAWGDTNWGGEDWGGESWGDTPTGDTGAGMSKANDGTQESGGTTSQWDGGDNSGGTNADPSDWGGGNADTTEKAGSDSANNVLGGNDGSNGSVEEEKKAKAKAKSNAKAKKQKKSKNEDPYGSNHIPGGFPSSPTKSEHSYSEMPPPTRMSPDNVGGGGGYGSPKDGSNQGSDGGKTTDNLNDWGDNGTGGSGDWGDNTVAQSSGGAFDDNSGWADGYGGDNNGATNDDVQW